MNKKSKKILRNAAVITFIICGLVWVCSKFIHLGRGEDNDNAKLKRNMLPNNYRVKGFIQKICFDDFQFLHKGDKLVVI